MEYSKLLDLFVDKSPYAREELKAPYTSGGYTIATNEKIYIAVEKSMGYPEQEKYNLLHILEERTKSHIVTKEKIEAELKKIPLVDVMTEKEMVCPECNGEGEVLWSYFANDGTEYEETHDCPVCEGSGKIYKEMPTSRKEHDPKELVKISNAMYIADRLFLLHDIMEIVGVEDVTFLCCHKQKASVIRINDKITMGFMPTIYENYRKKITFTKLKLW